MNDTEPTTEPPTDTDTDINPSDWIPGMTRRQASRFDDDAFPQALEPVNVLDTYVAAAFLPKGGVGKSTTIAHLARECSNYGYRTLVFGMAGLQTEAADQLGVEYRSWDDDEFPNVATIFNKESRSGVINLLGGADDFADSLIREGRGDVDVIPAHQHLDGLENYLPDAYPNPVDRYSILSDFITGDGYDDWGGLSDRYDVILLDAPGAPSEIVSNVIWAAQNVIAPVTQGQFEAGQVESLLYELQKVRKHGRDVRLISILPNQFDMGTTQASRLLDQYRERYHDLLAPGVVPSSADIRTAQENGMTAYDLDDPSETAQRALWVYPILAMDLLARIEYETFQTTAAVADDAEKAGGDSE